MSGWKPGDVAWVFGEEPSGRSAIEFSEAAIRTVDGKWSTANGEVIDEWVFNARQMITVDPETLDFDLLERALNRWVEWSSLSHERAAIRYLLSLLEPSSPKPDEPANWLSVVEDREGVQWYRWSVRPMDLDRAWISSWDEDRSDPVAYAAIDAVTVLSEGVPS